MASKQTTLTPHGRLSCADHLPEGSCHVTDLSVNSSGGIVFIGYKRENNNVSTFIAYKLHGGHAFVENIAFCKVIEFQEHKVTTTPTRRVLACFKGPWVVKCDTGVVEWFNVEERKSSKRLSFAAQISCMYVQDENVFIAFAGSNLIRIFNAASKEKKVISLNVLSSDDYPSEISVVGSNTICVISKKARTASSYDRNDGKPICQYRCTSGSGRRATSITTNDDYGLVIILWNRQNVLFYSVSIENCLFEIEVYSANIIRITNNLRLISADFNNTEVFVYDLPKSVSDELLPAVLASAMKGSNLDKLLRYFSVTGEYAAAINNSVNPHHAFLQHIRQMSLLSLESTQWLGKAFCEAHMENANIVLHKYISDRYCSLQSEIDKLQSTIRLLTTRDTCIPSLPNIHKEANYLKPLKSSDVEGLSLPTQKSVYECNESPYLIVSEWLNPPELQTREWITSDGGILDIPNTGVQMAIPPGAVEDACLIEMKIIPRLFLREPSKTFGGNATVVVELSPKQLTLTEPAVLHLPHCLQLSHVFLRTTKVFMAYRKEGGRLLWKEQPYDMSNTVNQKYCKILLNRLGWVKSEIDENFVEAKRIKVCPEVYSPGENLSTTNVGYYLDLPGEDKVFKSDQQVSFLFVKEAQQPLEISFTSVTPRSWQHDGKLVSQIIPFHSISNDEWASRAFQFHKKIEKSKDIPTSNFKISQGTQQVHLSCQPERKKQLLKRTGLLKRIYSEFL